MSDTFEHLKQQIRALGEEERWKLREWLETHTVDLDTAPNLRELLHVATQALGDEHRARLWLQSSNVSLGAVPVVVARRSQEDFCEVRDLLQRIRFGLLA